jgi:hypothetical protein
MWGRAVFARDSLRDRFPTAVVLVQMLVIVSGIGVVGFAILPLVGH